MHTKLTLEFKTKQDAIDFFRQGFNYVKDMGKRELNETNFGIKANIRVHNIHLCHEDIEFIPKLVVIKWEENT